VESVDVRRYASAEEKAPADLMAVALEDDERHRHPEEFAKDPTGLLRSMKEESGISQAEMARIARVSGATMSQIPNGKRVVSKAVALRLTEHLRIRPEALLR
jgi:plasmid maintenance system antidote protein VapI